MKVCVTGGAGYIGSHACKALARAGHEVVVYDNLATGHRRFALFGPFEYGDIRDTQKLRAGFRRHKPDAVIHFAAFSSVGESVADPGKYFRNNVGGTLSLLEAMRDESVPAIVVSGSAAVYGQPDVVPIREDAPKRPVNPYGASKLFMERMLSDFARAHDLRWMSLRYFNAAGSSPDGDIGELHDPETHLVPRAVLAGLKRVPPLEIFGDDYQTPDGTCVRDYIDVRDLAVAHILAVERLLAGGESQALNLGSETGSSVREIINGIEKIAGREIPRHMGPRRPGDPARLVADAAKAREVLNWRPQIPLEETLVTVWNFLASRQEPAFKSASRLI